MLLALNINNTNISIGAFNGMELVRSWRVHTDRDRTSDEYELTLRSLLGTAGLGLRDFTGLILGSVVPPLTPVVARGAEGALGIEARVVRPESIPGTRALVDNPSEVGVDRLLNCAAVRSLYGGPAIVVDLGTATTFDVVSGEGDYLGGVIAPGMGTSAEALFRTTSQLPRIEIRRPASVIGKNTVACMQSGVYWGYAHLVRGTLEAIGRELGGLPKVLATGGFAQVIADAVGIVDHVNPSLTLQGLAVVHEALEDSSK